MTLRILGLDVGTVRIGVALSDETRTIASPLTTLNARLPTETLTNQIKTICDDNQVIKVVIGLPLSMSGGDRGESARMAKQFGERLADRTGIEITYLDERFTSTQAERSLLSANLSRKKRKSAIDKVAAALFLQSYLDCADS